VEERRIKNHSLQKFKKEEKILMSWVVDGKKKVRQNRYAVI